MRNFSENRDFTNEQSLNFGLLEQEGNLNETDRKRLRDIKEAWNFYEGYHWEGIDDLDHNQVTYNYIKPFVDKFVAFEVGKGFNISAEQSTEHDEITLLTQDSKVVNKDGNGDGIIEREEQDTKELRGKTKVEFLEQVWNNNNKSSLLTELAQAKSITGDSWVQVTFESHEDINDPFNKFPNGRIRLTVIPTQYVYPDFDQHDKDLIVGVLIMYPVDVTERTGILFNRTRKTQRLYKEYWTKDSVTINDPTRGNEPIEIPNPYGLIPIVHFKNMILAGRSYGGSDINDLIPLNVEYNTKKSDVSEILDYHSAPITLVYGAKIGNLEKGANKVWGGLPKDSKVENLALNGDLSASNSYNASLKTAMCEIAGVPETVLGGASAISNTSGVALHYMNLPLIDKTNIKIANTKKGLEEVNELILYIGLLNNLIQKEEDYPMSEFVYNSVELNDTLPKDELLELQQIETEMKLGLECRHGALKRLGRDNITGRLEEIDREILDHPELFGVQLQQQMGDETQLNSGFTNGQTPIEQVRTEVTGSNGMTNNM